MPEFFTDTPLLTERFDAALRYATTHHAQQLRKGTPIPYAAHLLAVASLVLEMHGDEDEAIGALLHDVVEDGGGPDALRVSLADKLHNARSILIDYRAHGDALWARFGQRKGLATRIYYRELVAAFEREAPRMGEHAAPAIDELRRVVDAITALAEERQGPDVRVRFELN
jgi:GTP pyrophosphokinase